MHKERIPTTKGTPQPPSRQIDIGEGPTKKKNRTMAYSESCCVSSSEACEGTTQGGAADVHTTHFYVWPRMRLFLGASFREI